MDPFYGLYSAGKQDHYHFRFHISHLKFVSCGNAETLGLGSAFIDLVSVYDKYVWLGTLSCVVLLSLAVRQISRFSAGYPVIVKESIFGDTVLSIAKVLLEQGDPIRVSLYRHLGSNRILFTSFLMVGIVLSTLFKNENISKITLPFQAIPYDNLPSLISNNFIIYTRGTYYSTTNLRTLPIFRELPFAANLFSLMHPKGNYSQHQISFFFQSELYIYGQGETSTLNWQYWFFSLESMPTHVYNLMKITNLLPNWMDQLINFNEGQNEILNNCNKTALLLPGFEANSLYYELKSEGKSAFLGEDLDMSVEFGIKFLRRVNPQILVRMKSLYSAGLWNWWTKILVDDIIRIIGGFSERNVEPLKASDMNGNIIVVFLIYCSGIIIGLATYSNRRCYSNHIAIHTKIILYFIV